MIIANKTAFGLLLVLIAIGAAYLISGSRQEKLQANVYTKVNNGKFPESQLTKTCPNQVADVDSGEADYTLDVGWLSYKEGWAYLLKRKDGATLEFEGYSESKAEPDAARIMRKVCHDIQRDFSLWLNTQRVRASIGKPAQSGEPTSADDDPPRRYEMMEYRNGAIVGQALLDTKLGRLWTLTNIVNPAGKTERTEFKEISVEDLWESEDEADSLRPHEDQETFIREEHRLSRLRALTRPAAIQRAEDQAEKER
jgi:hypothetical protein